MDFGQPAEVFYFSTHNLENGLREVGTRVLIKGSLPFTEATYHFLIVIGRSRVHFYWEGELVWISHEPFDDTLSRVTSGMRQRDVRAFRGIPGNFHSPTSWNDVIDASFVGGWDWATTIRANSFGAPEGFLSGDDVAHVSTILRRTLTPRNIPPMAHRNPRLDPSTKVPS
jgi:hypothetical protein